MERISALPRGMQLMLVAGVLLLIDTFLNWQEVSVLGISAGVSAWHGWGVFVGLLTILLLAWLVARIAATDIRLPISDTLAGAALAALILLFTLIKVLLADNEFRTTWAWIGLVLAVLIAIGAWLQVTAGGGMDTLRTEASGLRTRAGGTSAPTSPPPQAPPGSEPAPPPPPVDETPPQGGDRT